MLGAYIAYSLVSTFGRGPLGFWGAVVLAALAVALIGVLIETLLLKRIYAAPELLQLAATFGVVLIVRDAALLAWGAEDLLGPRAPGLERRDGRFRPADPHLRSVPARGRPAGAAGALGAAGAHPVRHADARRDREPHARRRAGHQRADAVHHRVRARRLPRGARGSAAAAAGAGQSGHGSRDHRGSVRRHRRRRAGLDPGGLRRRAPDRPHQGAVHRARHGRGRRPRDRVPQAHARGRIRRDGGRAHREALRPHGRRAFGAADHAARRVPRARRAARPPRRARRAGRARRWPPRCRGPATSTG